MQIHRATWIGLTALIALAITACSGTRPTPDEPGQIKKVKIFHLEPGKRYLASDTAIPFEKKYHLYGAVTRDDRLDRYGQYYTVFWKSYDTARPVTVRFEYRQKLTGPQIKVIEQLVPGVRRSNETKLQVTGDPYFTDGPVVSWRISLLQGGAAIASHQSFLWE